MMNINSLPNELLVKIFTKTESLKLLFRLRVICRKWKDVAELVLGTQKSLRLFFPGVDFIPYGSFIFLKDRFHEKDTLLFRNGLHRDTIECLVEKMPLVERFELYKCPTENEDLMYFLTGWQETLSQLIIIFPMQLVLIDYEVQDQLIMMIEEFNLRHLYLLGAGFDTDYMLPYFKKLRTIFHCDFNQTNNYSWSTAMQNVGDQVESMHFVSPWITSDKLDRAFPNMKRLSVNVDSLENIEQLCDNFSSLTHLNLVLKGDCGLMRMLPHLSRLTKLTNLRISTLNELSILPLGFDIPNIFLFYKITPRNFQRRLVQLPSVKKLHLCVELKVARLQYLDHIFPNVEEITLNRPVFKCECQFPNIGNCVRCSVAIYQHFHFGFAKLKQVYSEDDLMFTFRDQDSNPINVLGPLFYRVQDIIVPRYLR